MQPEQSQRDDEQRPDGPETTADQAQLPPVAPAAATARPPSPNSPPAATKATSLEENVVNVQDVQVVSCAPAGVPLPASVIMADGRFPRMAHPAMYPIMPLPVITSMSPIAPGPGATSMSTSSILPSTLSPVLPNGAPMELSEDSSRGPQPPPPPGAAFAPMHMHPYVATGQGQFFPAPPFSSPSHVFPPTPYLTYPPYAFAFMPQAMQTAPQPGSQPSHFVIASPNGAPPPEQSNLIVQPIAADDQKPPPPDSDGSRSVSVGSVKDERSLVNGDNGQLSTGLSSANHSGVDSVNDSDSSANDAIKDSNDSNASKTNKPPADGPKRNKFNKKKQFKNKNKEVTAEQHVDAAITDTNSSSTATNTSTSQPPANRSWASLFNDHKQQQ